MADGTAYAASGGWSGGSALNAGGVLSNYYQKLKAVDPTSGSLTAAQPTQPSTQPSSLARVATTTPATQATPTTQATTALPTIAAAPLTMVQLPNMTAPAATSTAVAGTGVGGTGSTSTVGALGTATNGVQADIHTALHTGANSLGAVSSTYVNPPAFGGAGSINFRASDGHIYPLTYNPKTNQYMGSNYQTMIDLHPDQAAYYQGLQAAQNQAAAEYNKSVAPQLAAQAGALVAYKQQQAAAAIKAQQDADQAKAAAAQQNALDQASAFNLAASLQAPNTQDVDQAGVNDLARVRSQYASGLGGVDAAAYNFAGQGAQATQAAVNAAAHQTAYANAFNQNYATFANALTAQQNADANASAQKLNYDVQGISQAVAMLEQQASQLSVGKQTAFNNALTPLKQQLKDYQLAVKNNDTNTPDFLNLVKSILAGGSQLAAVAV